MYQPHFLRGNDSFPISSPHGFTLQTSGPGLQMYKTFTCFVSLTSFPHPNQSVATSPFRSKVWAFPLICTSWHSHSYPSWYHCGFHSPQPASSPLWNSSGTNDHYGAPLPEGIHSNDSSMTYVGNHHSHHCNALAPVHGGVHSSFTANFNRSALSK